ncbi:CobW family GTP-binding protein [Nocardioides bizhenqiangii]|uniref:GTP-binding protein n=1 Tax=Nocardioides bizhenqiangii TaxID=3095076 RepID=A0ABZ0ZT71_9ACTN|nr:MULTISPECIES: GTP-binding protein [unclassified Nocardioides]MDZ5622583.1 GTP-binding protein [Nocardioides sp. HM23]WQQ26852.1 GTP-binding protein [Nocardioides sp. HM61]
MQTPVVLVTGVDPDAMATTMVGLQFGLPGAVAVRHHIDVERQVLTRTVSDLTGVLEQHEITLEHACVSCAIREDVLPTLERLARDGRWQSIVAHLPVGGEAGQVCWVLARENGLARLLRVTAVVAAVSGQDPVQALLGADLLAERGVHSSHDDRRGVGEVLGALVEHADVIAFDGATDPVARGLVRTLARPDATIVTGASDLDDATLTGRLHHHSRTEAWTAPTRAHDLPLTGAEGIWQLDLRSSFPFHPGRLLDSLEQLGTGHHRSRGCFWLPTRPGRVIAWDGAGGQLSIGHHGPWGDQEPFTRIVMTGVGVAPEHARAAFAAMLVQPGETWHRGSDMGEDGFEPWLGPIRDAA